MTNAVSVPARILGTGSVFPGAPRTTAEVAAMLGMEEKAAAYEQRTGIRTRHWAEPGTLMAPLAAEAVRVALADAGLDPLALRRIILVRGGSGDLIFPATANRVASSLGLAGSCDCFDLSNACMGFLSGLDVAARCVATGLGPVAVVAADLCSRGIRPSDHRPFLVFGDGAAAAIVGPARPGEGILASFYGNDGNWPDDVFAKDPTLTSQREYTQFAKTNAEIVAIALAAIGKGVAGVLDRARASMGDIEWVVLHQPNGALLDVMIQHLGVDPARTVRVVQDIGSVASVSIPACLDRLMRTRPVRAGDRILLAGVGGGVSYGALLYRVGGET
jgi:3-oxoacyl-(acyl-carrier-protein) synthase III